MIAPSQPWAWGCFLDSVSQSCEEGLYFGCFTLALGPGFFLRCSVFAMGGRCFYLSALSQPHGGREELFLGPSTQVVLKEGLVLACLISALAKGILPWVYTSNPRGWVCSTTKILCHTFLGLSNKFWTSTLFLVGGYLPVKFPLSPGEDFPLGTLFSAKVWHFFLHVYVSSGVGSFLVDPISAIQ